MNSTDHVEKNVAPLHVAVVCAVVMLLIVLFITAATSLLIHQQRLASAAETIEQDLNGKRNDAQLAFAAMKDRGCSNLKQTRALQDLSEADALSAESGKKMLEGRITSSYLLAVRATRQYEDVSAARCAVKQQYETALGESS